MRSTTTALTGERSFGRRSLRSGSLRMTRAGRFAVRFGASDPDVSFAADFLFGTDVGSRTTSRGDLSSRTPTNTGWRNFPSAVHSLNLISTTTEGRVQWAGSLVRGGGENGDRVVSIRPSRLDRS